MDSIDYTIKLQAEFHNQLQPGQFFESLFEAIPGTYLFIKNTKGQFISSSTPFARLIGADSPGELIGKTDFDFMPDFIATGFVKADKLVFQNKKLMNIVELVPTVTGSLDWLTTSKIPLFGKDGSVVGLAGITRVIDESDGVYNYNPEMRSIVTYLRDNYPRKISMAEVAKQAGISVSKQERLFKKAFGITPLVYLQKIRLNSACDNLVRTRKDLADIAVTSGFNDQSNMTRSFRTELNITPLKFRKKYSPSKNS